jgi:hypothetical protein
VARLLNGTANNPAALEHELIVLARKTCEQPTRLGPDDLINLRKIVGDSALDYAFVAVSFHFINRISDTLGIVTELLPAGLRRFEFLRRMSVGLLGLFMRTMDLSNRQYDVSYDKAVERITPLFEGSMGRPPGAEFDAIRERPKLVEAIQLILEERDRRSSLDRSVMAIIHHTVKNALPRSPEDISGFHSRPGTPIEDFAFVGTRYAYRTTEVMIDALRADGFDDLGILDLATSIADANQWARLHRLLGLPSELFYVQ